MTEEQKAQFAGCIFRIAFLLKMVDGELNFYAKFKAPSGIKNEFTRLAKVYGRGIDNLKVHMPNHHGTFKEEIESSEDKIAAIGKIVEILSALPEEEVTRLEDVFLQHITPVYK